MSYKGVVFDLTKTSGLTTLAINYLRISSGVCNYLNSMCTGKCDLNSEQPITSNMDKIGVIH